MDICCRNAQYQLRRTVWMSIGISSTRGEMSVGKLKNIGKIFRCRKSDLQTTCIERKLLDNWRLKLCQYMSDRISVLHILLTPMRQVSWLMRGHCAWNFPLWAYYFNYLHAPLVWDNQYKFLTDSKVYHILFTTNVLWTEGLDVWMWM